MFYTSIKRKKFSTRKNFLWSHLFKETYLLTSAKELIIRWPLSWSPWLPNIILNYICPSWATSCHRSPSGWEGPLTHSSPEGRGCGGVSLLHKWPWAHPWKTCYSVVVMTGDRHKPWVPELSISLQRKKYAKKLGGSLGLKEGHVFVRWRERRPSVTFPQHLSSLTFLIKTLTKKRVFHSVSAYREFLNSLFWLTCQLTPGAAVADSSLLLS